MPGVGRLLAALVFPPGIIMVTLTGIDLCTTSFMFTSIAVFHQRLSIWRALLHWVISFFGNLAGALFMVCVIFGYGGSFDSDPWKTALANFATTRQVKPTWPMLFLRGIGCNWLVCLGCFFAMQGRGLVAKAVALYIPIFTFVVLSFDHVVANMFFIPMSIWVGHPSVTIGLYIWKGILPVLMGNILGGSVMCGAYHHLMYSWRTPEHEPAALSPKSDLESGLSRRPSSLTCVVTETGSAATAQIVPKD
ncbi:putative formate transporter [Cyphellophora attinorum]|uniref:Putative formate transporter n=1 Tax=Cyphellophora attinorum TaxID=1664694 RepID=A0A0N1P4L7_9EURO|nr:putative formate transporter [Phialophora attinorum]KPI45986.1 putative formate transporter [Phialophora attinorum]